MVVYFAKVNARFYASERGVFDVETIQQLLGSDQHEKPSKDVTFFKATLVETIEAAGEQLSESLRSC